MWADELLLNFPPFLIYSNIPKNNFTSTFWAYEDIRPNRIVDLSLCLPIRMKRLVHPSTFLLNLLKNAFSLFFKRRNIDWRVVVVSNKSCRWGKIIEDSSTDAQFRKRPPNLFAIFIDLFLQNGPIRLHLVAERHHYFAVAFSTSLRMRLASFSNAATSTGVL